MRKLFFAACAMFMMSIGAHAITDPVQYVNPLVG